MVPACLETRRGRSREIAEHLQRRERYMNIVKTILQKAGILNRVKYSFAGRMYFAVFKPGLQRNTNNELAFYRSFLPVCKLIFDIGSNDGHKTIVFCKLAGKVVACDPDPFNTDILEARFRNNKQVCIEAVAITDHIGESELYIEKPGSALNSINPKWKTILENENNNRWNEPVKFTDKVITVPVTTLDNLINKYGIPDYIKIDVEGNEKNVLKGLTQPVKYISYEVLLPEFLTDAMECMDLICIFNSNTVFNYAVAEKLMLTEFLSPVDFKVLLKSMTIPHLEIIAKS